MPSNQVVRARSPCLDSRAHAHPGRESFRAMKSEEGSRMKIINVLAMSMSVISFKEFPSQKYEKCVRQFVKSKFQDLIPVSCRTLCQP